MIPVIVIRLEKDKLSRKYFINWYMNLKIVLKHKKKMYFLEQFIPEQSHAANAPCTEKDAQKKHQDDALDIDCHMLAPMNPELQKQHKNMSDCKKAKESIAIFSL